MHSLKEFKDERGDRVPIRAKYNQSRLKTEKSKLKRVFSSPFAKLLVKIAMRKFQANQAVPK